MPLRVGICGEHVFEGLPDLLLTCEFFAVDIRTGGGLEYAVVCHVRHDRVEIVSIERVGEGLEKAFGYLVVGLGHNDCREKQEYGQYELFHGVESSGFSYARRGNALSRMVKLR